MAPISRILLKLGGLRVYIFLRAHSEGRVLRGGGKGYSCQELKLSVAEIYVSYMTTTLSLLLAYRMVPPKSVSTSSSTFPNTSTT